MRWGESQIHVRPEVAKGSREAVVYMDAHTEALLERWKSVCRRYAARRPHLFTTLQGGPVGRKYVWEMVSRYARRAGIERPGHPHVLRHTYATELLRDGFSIVEVQRLLRHADLRTTAIYLHVVDVRPIPPVVSLRVVIRRKIGALKKRRRSVRPNDLHALLSEAGFERRYGKGDHWVYTHPERPFPLTIDPRNPLLPAHPRDRGGVGG